MLEHIRNQLDLKKMVVAPTGVAALNIGGSTINSAFRIGFETIPVITKSKDPRFGKLLRNLELLIGFHSQTDLLAENQNGPYGP